MFKKEKSFLNNRKEYLKPEIKKIQFATIDSYSVNQIKRNIRKRIAKDNKRQNLMLFLLIILTLFLVAFMTYSSKENYKKQEIAHKEVYFKNNINQFNYLLKSGDEWLDTGKYHNAIFQYKLALKIFSDNEIAEQKLLDAYNFRCLEEHKDCDKASN